MPLPSPGPLRVLIGRAARRPLSCACGRSGPPPERGADMVQRIILLPVGVIGGMVAGALGKRLFERIWAVFDKQEPPSPEHRDASWIKLTAALVIEGAIFRLARGLI